jgi:hypothetical protein
MNEHAFEGFTRSVANPVSRRSALATLSGAALAAGLLAPATGAAKDNKAKKKCKRQRRQCEAAVQTFCDALLTGESVTAQGGLTCAQVLLPCCAHFSTCNASAGTTCLLQFD